MRKGLHHLVAVSSVLMSGMCLAAPLPEIDCLIEPNMTIELSSPVSGVLDTILVDRSDTVTKGQIVATLKSDVEQVQVTSSKEKLKLSRVEHKRAVELYRDNVITLSEKEQSDSELKLFELELKQAEANLEQRRIRSPIDAVVADRYLMPGEFVEDNPILKIAQLDPLRVEVVSPVAHFGRIKKGMHAQIKTEFGNFDDLVAKVVVVDKVIDAASGTFGIRLELPNSDNRVPGGLKCKVRFFSQQEEAEYVRLHPDKPVSKPEIALAEESVTDKVEQCFSLGPFKQKDKLEQILDAMSEDISRHDIRTGEVTSVAFQVSSGSYETRLDARTQEAAMKEAGVKDIAIMSRDSGYSVALGLFSNEKSAYARQARLKKIGFDSEVSEQNIVKKVYWADLVTSLDKEDVEGAVAASSAKSRGVSVQACEAEI